MASIDAVENFQHVAWQHGQRFHRPMASQRLVVYRAGVVLKTYDGPVKAQADIKRFQGGPPNVS